MITDYRISKGQDITYALQNSTRNTLSGISPLSNRKMFNSYHQPSFIYGTDTMTINETDLERLEVKYRQVLRHMMSLPKYTKTSLIYFSIGVLPLCAQRDLEILGVFGQLAICEDDKQTIRRVIENSLTFYDMNFNGWSGLVRKTCLRYDLPDPLEYMKNPWRPDRWRQYCKEKIVSSWEFNLKGNLDNSQQANLLQVEHLSLSKPLQIWEQAGLDSTNVMKTSTVSWMLLGVYQTREKLKEMNLAKSAECSGCPEKVNESLEHLIFYCSYYQKIRETYLPQFININCKIVDILDNEHLKLLAILDPKPPKLPPDVRNNWSCATTAYQISRNFCHDLHKKRKKLYEQK